MTTDDKESSDLTYRELYRLCYLAETTESPYRFSEFIKLMGQLESLGYVEIFKPAEHPNDIHFTVLDSIVTLTQLGYDSIDAFESHADSH